MLGPSPCSVDWDGDDLVGEGNTRNCKVCSQNVLNLSALTRSEAKRALTDPKVGCVHLLIREDETPVFKEEKSFKWQTPRLFAWVWTGMFLAFGSGCSGTVATGLTTPVTSDLQKYQKQDNQAQEPLQQNSEAQQVLPKQNDQSEEFTKETERSKLMQDLDRIIIERNQIYNRTFTKFMGK